MDILISLAVQIIWILVGASVVTLAYVTFGILSNTKKGEDDEM